MTPVVRTRRCFRVLRGSRNNLLRELGLFSFLFYCLPCVGPTWPEQGWCHALCWSHMARARLVSCPVLVPHGQCKVGVMPCVGPTWPVQGWCHALCWSHMARARLVSCPVLVPHGQSKADVTPVQLGLVCFSVAPLCDA